MRRLTKVIDIPTSGLEYQLAMRAPRPLVSHEIGAITEELGLHIALEEWPHSYIILMDSIIFLKQNGDIYSEAMRLTSGRGFTVGVRLIKLSPDHYGVLKLLSYGSGEEGAIFDLALFPRDYPETQQGLNFVEIKKAGASLSPRQKRVLRGYLEPLGIPLHVLFPKLAAGSDLNLYLSYSIQSHLNHSATEVEDDGDVESS